MRASVDWNDALPSLSLPGVVLDRHDPSRLHDAPVAAKIRQRGTHAALTQGTVFRTVDAIQAPGVVEGS